MPTFEFDLPQEDFDFIQSVGVELGVSPSEALHRLLAPSKGGLSDEEAGALAEATMAKGGECVVPDDAYWADIHRGIEEAAQASKSGAGKVA